MSTLSVKDGYVSDMVVVGVDGAGDARLGDDICRLVTFAMAAFKTCVKAGLIPQAKQAGRGVWAFAATGSKLDGTGFGKLHIVQTQVDAEACGLLDD